MKTTNDRIVLEDDDGLEITLPTKFEVCPACEGKGHHDHPAFANGISAEDWNNEWDDEERESYLSGRYDVPCTECGGLRVVPVPDEERMDERMKKLWQQELDYRAELRHEQHLRERGIEY